MKKILNVGVKNPINTNFLKLNLFNFASKGKYVSNKLSDLKFNQHQSNPHMKTHTGLFPYIPLSNHPLVPGYTRLTPITNAIKTKIDELIEKDENQKFVCSVLKEKEDLKQIQIFENVNYVPEITSSKQVFEVGCLCEIKIEEDPHTQTQAIIIVPLSVCKIESFTIEPTIASNSLCEVKAIIFKEELILENKIEETLGLEILMKFKFIKEMFFKTIKDSKDNKFSRIVTALMENYNLNILNEVIWMALASLALPKFFHKYGFLTSEVSIVDIQNVLGKENLEERLEEVIKLFSKFTNKIDIWEKLEYEYDHNTERKKINEKLQGIYQNLKNMFESDKDDKNIQVERFKKNMEGKIVPEHIMKVFSEELERFMGMDKHSMESNVIRNYLDILTTLPYGVYTQDTFDLDNAKLILNQTHYGMDSVKQRILECIAVAKMKGQVAGKILCFAGPPGVGKTSIAESIAKSLGRKFHRIALGGDRDTSSLKGFRRTYVGAQPGKIISALKKAGTENPVILLDEIDKLTTRNHQGDPSSVLLEVLDPEQNSMFTDDYLDYAVDLSKVFFLCTANDLSYVPQPLLDRLEIIDVSGYTSKEKKFIYDNHLKPKAIINSGLNDKIEYSFEVKDDAVEKLISDYCRESGIRSLQRYTNRIFEKIAYQIVSENIKKIEVDITNLKKFIGPAHFSSKRIYEKTPCGVSVGLGFNNYGGTIMYIESNISDFKDKGQKLNITGNVGKVMNESCSIAVSYAKSFCSKKLNKVFFEENSVHLHFIEGAIEKDGPSAGIAITTAFLSLALNTPVENNIAMTGEISLLGKVLPIGGVKEKVMAGKREGMSRLILPIKNKDDVLELPDYIKEGLEFYFVENYEEVFKICFPNVKI